VILHLRGAFLVDQGYPDPGPGLSPPVYMSSETAGRTRLAGRWRMDCGAGIPGGPSDQSAAAGAESGLHCAWSGKLPFPVRPVAASLFGIHLQDFLEDVAGDISIGSPPCR